MLPFFGAHMCPAASASNQVEIDLVSDMVAARWRTLAPWQNHKQFTVGQVFLPAYLNKKIAKRT